MYIEPTSERKLIIVEGMDSVGKDTQIKRITSHYHDDIFHTLHYHAIKGRTNEQARKLSEETYNSMLHICSLLSRTNIILNRSHYGEYVYGKLYRDYADPEYVFNLDLRHVELLKSAKLIILVNSDFDELLRREDGDSLSQGQAQYSTFCMSLELDRFKIVYDLSIAGNKMWFDVRGLSIDQIAKRIATWLDGCYDSTNNDSSISS